MSGVSSFRVTAPLTGRTIFESASLKTWHLSFRHETADQGVDGRREGIAGGERQEEEQQQKASHDE
jgi:hypothetical protein